MTRQTLRYNADVDKGMDATTNEMRDKANQDQEGVCLRQSCGQRQTMRNATINNDKDTTMTRDDNEDERQ